jgi:hypothetical protein
MVAEYVKKIFKYVKKVNMYGYNVHLREGCHHQYIKFTKIEHKPKKKVVKERRPRQKAIVNTKNWYRKETDLLAEFGKETPFGGKFSSKDSVKMPAVGSAP